jgi:hypothetical protein
MRDAAARVDKTELAQVAKAYGRPEGRYAGGFVSLEINFLLNC